MTLKPTITFKDIDQSDSISEDIDKHTTRLVARHPDIIDCHVIVSAPHKAQHKGMAYEVHIKLNIPGDTISVSKEHDTDPAHQDMYLAIRDAFHVAESRLSRRQGKAQDRNHSGPGLSDMVE